MDSYEIFLEILEVQKINSSHTKLNYVCGFNHQCEIKLKSVSEGRLDHGYTIKKLFHINSLEHIRLNNQIEITDWDLKIANFKNHKHLLTTDYDSNNWVPAGPECDKLLSLNTQYLGEKFFVHVLEKILRVNFLNTETVTEKWLKDELTNLSMYGKYTEEKIKKSIEFDLLKTGLLRKQIYDEEMQKFEEESKEEEDFYKDFKTACIGSFFYAGDNLTEIKSRCKIYFTKNSDSFGAACFISVYKKLCCLTYSDQDSITFKWIATQLTELGQYCTMSKDINDNIIACNNIHKILNDEFIRINLDSQTLEFKTNYYNKLDKMFENYSELCKSFSEDEFRVFFERCRYKNKTKYSDEATCRESFINMWEKVIYSQDWTKHAIIPEKWQKEKIELLQYLLKKQAKLCKRMVLINDIADKL